MVSNNLTLRCSNAAAIAMHIGRREGLRRDACHISSGRGSHLFSELLYFSVFLGLLWTFGSHVPFANMWSQSVENKLLKGGWEEFGHGLDRHEDYRGREWGLNTSLSLGFKQIKSVRFGHVRACLPPPPVRFSNVLCFLVLSDF